MSIKEKIDKWEGWLKQPSKLSRAAIIIGGFIGGGSLVLVILELL